MKNAKTLGTVHTHTHTHTHTGNLINKKENIGAMNSMFFWETLKKRKIHSSFCEQEGITIIALIITIIVLLILAGVTIATLTGNNGILTKATESSETSEREKTRERIGLSVQAANIVGRGQLEYNNLNEELKNEFGEDNYKILKVGKGYLIILDNVQYKIDAEGKVEEEKSKKHNNRK